MLLVPEKVPVVATLDMPGQAGRVAVTTVATVVS
jgi:hypothetical protein